MAALFVLLLGCSSSEDESLPLTFRAEKRELNVTMDAKGVLEARRSHQLISKGFGWGQRWPEIAYLAEDGSWVKKGDPVVEFSSSDILAEAENAQSELESAQAEMKSQEATHKQKVAQLNTQIENAELSLASIELQLKQLEFVAERERRQRELEIEKSKLQAKKSRRELKSLLEVYHEEKSQQQLRIKQAQAKVVAAKKSLGELVMYAPFDGYIVVERNRATDEKFKQGDTPYPNMPIAKIPDMSSMQVDLQLSETEIKNLEVGQRVEVTVSSVSNKFLPGKVSQVAKIAMPVSRGSDVKRVQATVVLDSLLKGMVPGLTASCNIKVYNDSTAIVVPIDAVFERDSLRVVYIRQGNKFVPREVKMAWRGLDFANIAVGLDGTEELALAEPKRSQLKSDNVERLKVSESNAQNQTTDTTAEE